MGHLARGGMAAVHGSGVGMRDERYIGNARGMFTPDNQSVIIGDHLVEYAGGTDPGEQLSTGTTPYVAIQLESSVDGNTTLVVVYRDFETGKVVVDVTGDPDRVLWNEATFEHDTNYEEV